MLTLCGFGASNYYNKVKLVLLEKGIPFNEELKWVGQADTEASPMGKIPYLKTEEGHLCESSVMVEYLEQAYKAHPLIPLEPFAAAKVRELHLFLDLHLELVARNLYPEAFFGGKVSEALKDKVGEQLQKNIAAFSQLVKFAPYIGGTDFTLADCVAAVHLPLITAVSKTIYGRDFLADLPIKAYMTMWSERASMQRVQADRKANNALFLTRMQSKP